MKGNVTYITDPSNKGNKKDFTFDYSYWSHDGFKEEKDGYLVPTDTNYADQVSNIYIFFILNINLFTKEQKYVIWIVNFLISLLFTEKITEKLLKIDK